MKLPSAGCSHALALLFSAVLLGPAARGEDAVDFEKQILPILEQKCFKCHSSLEKKPKGGLVLDTAEGLKEAMSPDGGSIVHGDPEESDLVWMIALPAGDEDVMPPAKENSPLTTAQVKMVHDWVAQGAPLGSFTTFKHKKETRVVVSPEEAKDVSLAAKRIDQLLLEGIRARGLEPTPPVDDSTFVRRAYLDLIGRNPTFEEARQFLASPAASKRSRLIDILLQSEGYVSHAFNHWADALRAKNDVVDSPADAYLAWIKQSLRENKPYDKMVTEMITAEGRFWQNPATGFFLRDEANRLAGVEAISGLFLGTEIGCAQCHDHPYDKWTRRDFHTFAGFMLGIHSNGNSEPTLSNIDIGAVRKMDTEWRDFGRLRRAQTLDDSKAPPLEGLSPQTRERVLKWSGHHVFGSLSYLSTTSVSKMVAMPGRSPYSANYWPILPADYQYSDAKPLERVDPTVLFGETPHVENREELPATLADWMTSPENPRFALVAANRMWDWMMGAPLVGPLTDVVEVKKSAYPPLVRYLEGLMIGTGYDLKQFLRIIAHTEAYQRQAVVAEVDNTKPALFAGPLSRRLTAEQVWDSLLVLVNDDIDKTVKPGFPDSKFLESLWAAKSMDEYWILMIDEAERQIEQSDTWFDRHRRAGELKKLGFDPKNLTRASEVSSPAPDGHFLRIFGQSDREQIDHAWYNPTIPQALTLMNGPLFAEIAKPGSAFQKALATAGQPEEKIGIVFMSVLGRPPAPEEVALVLETLREEKEHPYEDLAWALINTRQFLFKN